MKLTKADWEAGLKKWERGNDHDDVCRFCEIYSNKRDLPKRGCIDNGCPLATGGHWDRHNICCDGTWWTWKQNETEENALAVHDFIATKYIEWLEKNCGERKPKWARSDNVIGDFTKNKWYKIKEIDGKKFYVDSNHLEDICCLFEHCGHISGFGKWELCYDDEPPVEKKEPKWAKKTTPGASDFWKVGKWYRVHSGGCVETEDGDTCPQCLGGSDWAEVSYDEEKPVEKCSKCGQVLP